MIDVYALAIATSYISLVLVCVCAFYLMTGRRPPLAVMVTVIVALLLLSSTFLMFAGRAP